MAENRFEEMLARDWRELIESAPEPLDPPRGMPLSPTALFAQLEEVREDWRALVDDVREDELTRYVNAGWTLSELLAHLASWAKEFRRNVETAARGESFDYAIPFAMSVMGPTEWNEGEVAARHARNLEEIRDEFDEETTRLQELLLELSEPDLYGVREFPYAPSGDPLARWKGPSAAVIAGKCLHDRYHFQQIRKKLAEWR